MRRLVTSRVGGDRFSGYQNVQPVQSTEASPVEMVTSAATTGVQGLGVYNKLQNKKLETTGILRDADLTFKTKLPTGQLKDNNIFRYRSDLGPVEQYTNKWSERIEINPTYLKENSKIDAYNALKDRNISDKDMSNILKVDHDDFRAYSLEQDYLQKENLRLNIEGDMPGIRQGETPFTKGDYKDWLHNHETNRDW